MRREKISSHTQQHVGWKKRGRNGQTGRTTLFVCIHVFFCITSHCIALALAGSYGSLIARRRLNDGMWWFVYIACAIDYVLCVNAIVIIQKRCPFSFYLFLSFNIFCVFVVVVWLCLDTVKIWWCSWCTRAWHETDCFAHLWFDANSGFHNSLSEIMRTVFIEHGVARIGPLFTPTHEVV